MHKFFTPTATLVYLLFCLSLAPQVVAQSKAQLDRLYERMGRTYYAGRVAEALELAERHLKGVEKFYGPGHPEYGFALAWVAELLMAQGRFYEAEDYVLRANANTVKALPTDYAEQGKGLNMIGVLYMRTDRLGQSEAVLKKAIELLERQENGGLVSLALQNLAVTLSLGGRDEEAEPLAKRSLAMRQEEQPPIPENIALSISSLGMIAQRTGRYAEAEQRLKEALAINLSMMPASGRNVVVRLSNLASLYLDTGRPEDALPLVQQALQIAAQNFPKNHPSVAQAYNSLGNVLLLLRRLDEAEPFLLKARDIQASAHLDPKETVVPTANLAVLSFLRHDWTAAMAFMRQSTAPLVGALAGNTSAAPTGQFAFDSSMFRQHVTIAWHAGASDPALADEAFLMAQWAGRSDAAASLAQMTARDAKGDGALAQHARRRQDIERQLQIGQQKLSAALGSGEGKSTRAARQAVEALRTELIEVNEHLARDFPDYLTLANPKPVTIAEIQSKLGPKETFVQFLLSAGRYTVPSEAYAWAITKEKSKWVRLSATPEIIAQHVQALRCGIDESAWEGAGEQRCRSLLTTHRPSADAALPFDADRAHRLYEVLFGQIEDMISDENHLLVVASSALTSIPLHLLVTKPAGTAANYRGLSWLAAEHPISVLPSAMSLGALRGAHASRLATKPYIGFGDPLLMGTPDCTPVIVPERCPGDAQAVAKLPRSAHRAAHSAGAAPRYFRGGLANLALLRTLCPLPDTAHELRCVARSLGADESSILLSSNMTEKVLKQRPLDLYRVVHFATHGLLAGETAQLATANAEPALVLSPPDTASEDDDGLLTASEIAALKLNAEWVIMSACNTAGGGNPNAEALSGLARAFFYAGARALLVSHWPVDTFAATSLISTIFFEMSKDASVGRAEALRRAMLTLLHDENDPLSAHPSIWAPFVVVGDGSAARER